MAGVVAHSRPNVLSVFLEFHLHSAHGIAKRVFELDIHKVAGEETVEGSVSGPVLVVEQLAPEIPVGNIVPLAGSHYAAGIVPALLPLA